MKKIQIFDSTLRDGAQGEGISYSVQDKLSIVRALDDFGVDYIEAGNPASNPKDIEFFHRLKDFPPAPCQAMCLWFHQAQGRQGPG